MPNSLGGRIFFHLDKVACEKADRVLLDTYAHIEYFTQTFGIEEEKFQRAFVGADNQLFFPKPHQSEGDNTFTVFYYGSYLPLQGIDNIIQAAKELERCPDIKFHIVGTGPERQYVDKLALKLNVKNIRFDNWLPYASLPSTIANANVCLGGHFSNISKAKRVIAGKTFQFIAMGKPVIVGDNSANRELFTHRENAMLVEHANPKAIAEAIVELRHNQALRDSIADNGYRTFLERCTPEVIGKEIKKLIERDLAY